MNLDRILSLSPVIPVLTIRHTESAIPVARALVNGGLRVLEITLRTPVALDAIKLIRSQVEDVVIGAGTVLSRSDRDDAQSAGAEFIVSPGIVKELLDPGGIPYLPGIVTPSELISGLEAGLHLFKFFPALSFGGLDTLKSYSGPFPSARFCATGGINMDSAQAYLKLENVICVGGAWVAPQELIEEEEWSLIESLARQASGLSSYAHRAPILEL